MTVALYPASFDPITYGHVDIAERAARLFDKVVVATVEDREGKRMLFSTEERYAMTRQALAHILNLEVVTYNGLTVNFANKVGAAVIVRGLRAVSDFEAEMQFALANQSLAPEIDTVCLMNNQKYSFISSSIVKDIAKNGGTVSHLVPSHVSQALLQKYRP
jgi:pantetheine-phosphate adenylyltransferase